jgi:cyclopropane-fatty-acyl-phospholipid synthase
MDKAEKLLGDLLAHADVRINGSRAWDITVHNPQLYQRLLRDGVLGLGESYVDGWWDCDDLGEMVRKLLLADLEHVVQPLKLLLPVLRAKLMNVQNRSGASRDVPSHYNRGNLLFRNMLDQRMVYSCAYWKNADNLDDAQDAKLDLVCRKLGVKAGDHLLDIGCGWGSLLKFASERYGARGTGITLASEQIALGRELCQGLPIELRMQDYRDLDERFDHIVSIGMFEHVGPQNYRTYMEIAAKCLNDDGLFVLHTLGVNRERESTDPWTERYIFPGARLPVAEQIARAAKGLFVLEDWHNIGVYYAPTLEAWFANFDRNWNTILAPHYDERFYRMWKYLLLSTPGSFRARRSQVWQIVFSKKGVQGGYESVR